METALHEKDGNNMCLLAGLANLDIKATFDVTSEKINFIQLVS